MTSLFRIHPQPAFNFGGLVIDNLKEAESTFSSSVGLLLECIDHFTCMFSCCFIDLIKVSPSAAVRNLLQKRKLVAVLEDQLDISSHWHSVLVTTPHKSSVYLNSFHIERLRKTSLFFDSPPNLTSTRNIGLSFTFRQFNSCNVEQSTLITKCAHYFWMRTAFLYPIWQLTNHKSTETHRIPDFPKITSSIWRQIHNWHLLNCSNQTRPIMGSAIAEVFFHMQDLSIWTEEKIGQKPQLFRSLIRKFTQHLQQSLFFIILIFTRMPVRECSSTKNGKNRPNRLPPRSSSLISPRYNTKNCCYKNSNQGKGSNHQWGKKQNHQDKVHIKLLATKVGTRLPTSAAAVHEVPA